MDPLADGVVSYDEDGTLWLFTARPNASPLYGVGGARCDHPRQYPPRTARTAKSVVVLAHVELALPKLMASALVGGSEQNALTQ